jgi:hypothetical protein
VKYRLHFIAFGSSYIGFEVSTVVKIYTVVFWVMTPYILELKSARGKAVG